jgi:2,3-bisphosphoglycerate-independent phosphoglycerate mutase
MAKKVMLIIMDGWGKGKIQKADAIAHANVPFVSSLYHKYPNSELVTCGEAVGLPEGQMGNSEVGHLNIGAGRIVYQELEKVNVAIKNGDLANNAELLAAFQHAKSYNCTLHFMGLVSDGGVHSHINHIKALCDMAYHNQVPKVAIHAFTDGRDTDPKSGHGFISDLKNHAESKGAILSTVTGRFYAMDRDRRWERLKVAYDALTKGTGEHTEDVLAAIEKSYEKEVTDEFITPIIAVDHDGTPKALIRDGDVVICFNFRTDRCREISVALTQSDLVEHHMSKLGLYYVTMTEYDKNFKNVHILFENKNLVNTLGEVLERYSMTQIRIAETEKYPHVTFFFSGGREQAFAGEKRILIPSPRNVATYDLKPEMSALQVTAAIIPELKARSADFIVLNFANADMVGHTGVWAAVIDAVETVDNCLAKIVPTALENGYSVLLTADHGNADFMVNEDGSPNTAHSLNKVPLFFISNNFNGQLESGKLADIAPTILKYMGIPIPKEMTGNVLIDW